MDFLRRESGVGQRFLHCYVGTVPVGRGGCLMESVAGIAITVEPGQWFHPTFHGRGCPFEDDIGCSFAEIEPGACGVERTAGFPVEDHQRIESVEMEPGETFASACDYDVGHSAADHVGTDDDGVSGRRTGGRRSGDEPEPSEMVGDQFGRSSAVVGCDVGVVVVGCEKIQIITLAFIHASDSRSGNERSLGHLLFRHIGVGERFFECKHSQQRRADGRYGIGDSQY